MDFRSNRTAFLVATGTVALVTLAAVSPLLSASLPASVLHQSAILQDGVRVLSRNIALKRGERARAYTLSTAPTDNSPIQRKTAGLLGEQKDLNAPTMNQASCDAKTQFAGELTPAVLAVKDGAVRATLLTKINDLLKAACQ